jgi:hypothetical protein
MEGISRFMDWKIEHVDQLTSLSKVKGFLGREFLTWLWFTAETTKERLRLAGAKGQGELEVDLWIDDRIVLDGASGHAHQNVMKGGTPSHSREAAASLATGKTVREMKLGVGVKNAGEYSAILHCDDLNRRSLRLPGLDGEAAKAEVPLAARLKAIELFLAVLDGLFARFLAERSASDWDKTGLQEMRSWIRTRQGAGEEGTIH